MRVFIILIYLVATIKKLEAITMNGLPKVTGSIPKDSLIQDIKYQIVFLRHGESTFNAEDRFIGWTDVPLTVKGEKEAHQAGIALASHGFRFDSVITSMLKRAIKTSWLVLNELDQAWIPEEHKWELNERFFGDLLGKTGDEANMEFGEANVLKWQASYRIPPPPMSLSNPLNPWNHKQYRNSEVRVPTTECMADVEARVAQVWEGSIKPRILNGERLLICAHAICLKALIKYIDDVPEELAILQKIPRASPIVYSFDANFRPIPHPQRTHPWSGYFIPVQKTDSIS